MFVVGNSFLFCSLSEAAKKWGKNSLHESPWLDDDDIVLVSF
jgi:hypothetical protein